MGEVAIVEHVALGERRVMKLLRTDFAESADLAARLRTEARLLTRLQHENLVKVLDFGFSSKGRPFLVTELLRGEPLSMALKGSPQLPEREARDIARQTLRGARAGPRRLRPPRREAGQPLLREVRGWDEGEDRRLRRREDPDTRRPRRTRPAQPTAEGMVVGTPSYLSPEQALGKPRDVLSPDQLDDGVLIRLDDGHRRRGGAAASMASGSEQMERRDGHHRGRSRPIAGRSKHIPTIAWAIGEDDGLRRTAPRSVGACLAGFCVAARVVGALAGPLLRGALADFAADTDAPAVIEFLGGTAPSVAERARIAHEVGTSLPELLGQLVVEICIQQGGAAGQGISLPHKAIAEWLSDHVAVAYPIGHRTLKEGICAGAAIQLAWAATSVLLNEMLYGVTCHAASLVMRPKGAFELWAPWVDLVAAGLPVFGLRVPGKLHFFQPQPSS